MTNKSLTQTVLDAMNGIQPVKPEIETKPVDPQKKADLLNQLQHGVLVVEFTKVNGEKSVLECTLDSRLLPDQPAQDSQRRVEQPHLIHAYAVDRGGWRSFVVSNVIRTYRKPEAL